MARFFIVASSVAVGVWTIGVAAPERALAVDLSTGGATVHVGGDVGDAVDSATSAAADAKAKGDAAKQQSHEMKNAAKQAADDAKGSAHDAAAGAMPHVNVDVR
jgi:hypothetical protein